MSCNIIFFDWLVYVHKFKVVVWFSLLYNYMWEYYMMKVNMHDRDGERAWWMSIRMTAMSLNGDFGSRAKALEWLRSMSPNAQYTAVADGSVSVSTYRVASKYMALNFWGFHIACMISLTHQNLLYSAKFSHQFLTYFTNKRQENQYIIYCQINIILTHLC